MRNSNLASIMLAFFGLFFLGINFGMIYVNIVEWFFILILSLGTLICLITAWLVLQEKKKQRRAMLIIQKLMYFVSMIIVAQSFIYFFQREYNATIQALTMGLFIFLLARYGIRFYFEHEKVKEKMTEREIKMGTVETKSGNIILIILSIMFLANLILKFFQ